MASGASHPLDNPIWHALMTCQAKFAETSGTARRFPVEITTLAGFLEEPTPEGYAALASLARLGETAALFLQSSPAPTAAWSVIETVPLLQMLHERGADMTSAVEAEELCAADASEAMALAEVTKPGPFGHRTLELGTYLGVRRA